MFSKTQHIVEYMYHIYIEVCFYIRSTCVFNELMDDHASSIVEKEIYRIGDVLPRMYLTNLLPILIRILLLYIKFIERIK